MRQMRTLAMGYADGTTVESHAHDWDQLVYAQEGMLTVTTPKRAWLVPPNRAVWMPAGTDHELRCSGFVSLRTLYLPRGSVAKRACSVLEVSPLLRELVLHAVDLGTKAGVLDANVPTHRHVMAIVLDQLEQISTLPLELPLPTEPRARRVADALRAGADRTLDETCRRAGVTRRTIERLFRDELGISLGQWNTQQKLLGALPLLVEGESVTQTALACGYESPSAFITAFKRVFGETPARYRRARS